jgi:glycine oxidase
VIHVDVGIAGGGIIGLSTALELAEAGLRVIVFERGRAMSEASWAAAGMLAAGDPENPAQLRSLAEFSLRLYPEFLTTVKRLSGEDVPFRTATTIQCARHRPCDIAGIDPADLERGMLGAALENGQIIHLREQSIDPRDLVRALPKAAKAAGVMLLEETPVTAVTEHCGHVEIRSDAGSWRADSFVNCCGAWAGNLSDIPISPRKGQMAVVRHSGEPQLRVVLRTPEVYLVPRGDGRIVIGATVEDGGFDKQVDGAAVDSLLGKAAELWPPVREAQIIESWAGLRPASPDDLPILDQCGPRSWMATGHFRNGILLAPATARILRQMILGEPVSVDVAAFRCSRFALSTVHS